MRKIIKLIMIMLLTTLDLEAIPPLITIDGWIVGSDDCTGITYNAVEIQAMDYSINIIGED